MPVIVPLLALAVLITVAYVHPRGWIEAGAAVVAAGAVWATGALTGSRIGDEIDRLGPVVVFLVAILTVAESCRANGVFDVVGTLLQRVPDRASLLNVTFVVAAVVTVTLSLDATVVLLTPVVVSAARTRFVAGELTCVRLANSASLLLPVANLTNLLMMPHLDITFGRFALLMAPSWLVVLLVEYAALRTVAAREPDPARQPPTTTAAVPVFPLTVVAAMLAGFALASPYGVRPAWIACVAAAVLVAHDLATGRNHVRAVIARAHPAFAIFVLGLGLVVAGLGNGVVGDRVADLVPDDRGLGGLIVTAALGAVAANVVNNLPATMLLAPMVAPLGIGPALALLIGINVGASLTWTGSLANLLWRRALGAGGGAPTRTFHLTAAASSPVGIVLGVLVLDGWMHVVG